MSVAAIPPHGAPVSAVRGWILYDFANSAFVTTVVTALGGPFLTASVKEAAGENSRLSVLGVHPYAGSIYAYVTTLSVLVQVVLLPLLGASADSTAGRHRLLGRSTAVGVLATVAFALAPLGAWQLAAAALLVANVAFGAAIVAYNAYLYDVAAPPQRDEVSSRGFASGYLGGGLALAIGLVALTAAPAVGVTVGAAVRFGFLVAAAWWAGFGWLAWRRLAILGRPRNRARSLNRGGGATSSTPVTTTTTATTTTTTARVRSSLASLAHAARDLRSLPLTFRYLVAFLLFNDAIQAVVVLSSVFLQQELFVAKGLPADDADSFLLQLVLLIQFVAIGGAIGFARVARWCGAKRAVLASLVGWVAIIAYAYAYLQEQWQAWLLGVAIAIVLGGSQALARSLFSQMTPASRQTSFFGFYELAERGTAWIGTLIFAVVLDATESYRSALVSLVVLFVAGGALLAVTDTGAAISAAREWDRLESQRRDPQPAEGQ